MKLKIKVKNNKIIIDPGVDGGDVTKIYKKLNGLSPSYLSLSEKHQLGLNQYTYGKWYLGITFRQTKYPDRKLKKIREVLNIM